MSACVRKFVVVRAAAHVMFQIRTEENDSRSDSGKNFKSPPLLFSPSLASNCKASIFFSLLPGKLFRPVTPNHGGADGERGGGGEKVACFPSLSPLCLCLILVRLGTRRRWTKIVVRRGNHKLLRMILDIANRLLSPR